jgi:acyl-CoA reductase-like NAD-dependent aldehyde dehydrogenase
LKYANVSPYGRAGFVFENDSEKAARVAQKLEVGSVFINTAHARFDPLQDIPLEKKSGFSPEGGRSLARFFTRTLTMFSLPH